MHLPAVAFDFDGTIIDISQRDYSIYLRLVRELNGLPLPFENYWLLRKRKTDIHLILADSGIDSSDFKYFLDRRSDLMERLEYLGLDSLLNGVVNKIQGNYSNFVPYLVTTRHKPENLYSQLQLLGIDNLFSDIIIAGKDKTQSFAKVPRLQLIVGDTENDILAANRLGIKSVGVLSGIRDSETLSDYKPTVLSNSISDIDFEDVLAQ